MKSIHVHFVCTGNAYRSRLAEAYLKSKKFPDIEVSSSGVEERKHRLRNGPITWYAGRLLKRHNLIPHAKFMSTQTTRKLLDRADIVIFMTDIQHHIAKSKFKFNKGVFEIWNIGDIDNADFYRTEKDTDMMRIEHSEKTFEQIKNKVDTLAKRIIHENR